MKKYLLAGCVLMAFAVKAQTEFREGYIITKEKDTIYGELDHRGDRVMAKVCRFRKDDKVFKYRPSEISAYRFTDGKFFVSKKIEGRDIFLQFLIEGELNVYYFDDSSTGNQRFFMSNEIDGLMEIPYKEIIVELKGKHYLKKGTIHMGF